MKKLWGEVDTVELDGLTSSSTSSMRFWPDTLTSRVEVSPCLRANRGGLSGTARNMLLRSRSELPSLFCLRNALL